MGLLRQPVRREQPDWRGVPPAYKDAPQQTNRAPRIDPISNWAIGPGDYLSFPITATDLDTDRLAFRLESPAPSGAQVTLEGMFSWQPSAAQVQDEDTPVLNGGRLTVAVIEGSTPDDALGLEEPSETQTNITLAADQTVVYGTNVVGALTLQTGETNVLAVDFNTNATLAAVAAVVRTVTFSNAAVRGSSPSRVIAFTLSDGSGGTSVPADMAARRQATLDSLHSRYTRGRTMASGSRSLGQQA